MRVFRFVVVAGTLSLTACHSFHGGGSPMNFAATDAAHPPCAVERALVLGVSGQALDTNCHSHKHADYHQAHSDGLQLAELREEHARLSTKVYLQSLRLAKKQDAVSNAERDLLATFSDSAAQNADQSEVVELKARTASLEARLNEYRIAEQSAAASLANWSDTLARRYR